MAPRRKKPLKAWPLNKTDRDIARLRGIGLNQAEIGKIVGLEASWVGRRITSLKAHAAQDGPDAVWKQLESPDLPERRDLRKKNLRRKEHVKG